MKKVNNKLVKQVTLGSLLMFMFLSEVNAQWSSYIGMPIAYWDFQNTVANPTTFQTTVKQQVNSGNVFNGKFGGASTTINGVVGNGTGAYGGSYPGQALSAAGWCTNTTDPGAAATTYYQFSINTTGFTGIQIGFDVKGGGLNYPYSGICYSTNGGTTWNAGTSFLNGTSWDYGCNYTLPASANNNSALEIRIYGWNSNNAASGNILIIDNVIVLASGTIANAGTLNLLNEQDLYTSYTPGYTGYFNRNSFTVLGPGTNVVVNNNYNSIYGSPYYSEIGMSLNQTFAVTTNATVTFGSMGDITSMGKFTLNAGCNLVTAHPDGISANGNNSNGNGSVTVAGTKTFDPGANYTFNGTTAQITNGGFPTSLTGNLTINNSVSVSLTNSFTSSGTVTLQSGGLILNGNSFSITNNSPTAITSAGGYIQSETNLSQNPSTLTLSMATGTGLTYVFPFGSGGTSIPFTFTKTSNAAVNVSVSTRHTGADNTPYAGASDGGTVPAVSNMVCGSGGNATTSVIDRWWDIYASGAVTANLIFSYLGSEDATMNSGYQTGTIKAQHWNGTSWDLPVGNGTGVTSGVGTVAVTGISTFSPWVLVASSNPLPIELVNFNATPETKSVFLNWTTSSEINNDYFTIERSINGEQFTPISTVKGAGNSNSILNYSTIDKNPIYGASYYRLKQTDYNGNSVTFNTIIVNYSGETSLFSVFPNPNSGDNINLSYMATNSGDNFVVAISDITGRKVFNKTVIAENEGVNTFSLNPEINLGKGIYFLTCINNTNKYTEKLIVK